MSKTSVHQDSLASRALSGISLYRERGVEIRPLEDGGWRVPSCSGTRYYVVDLERETCTCPDYRSREQACKHVFAAATVASRKGKAVSFMAELRARRAEELAAAVAEPLPAVVDDAAVRVSYDLYLSVCGMYPHDGVLVEAARSRHREALRLYAERVA